MRSCSSTTAEPHVGAHMAFCCPYCLHWPLAIATGCLLQKPHFTQFRPEGWGGLGVLGFSGLWGSFPSWKVLGAWAAPYHTIRTRDFFAKTADCGSAQAAKNVRTSTTTDTNHLPLSHLTHPQPETHKRATTAKPSAAFQSPVACAGPSPARSYGPALGSKARHGNSKSTGSKGRAASCSSHCFALSRLPHVVMLGRFLSLCSLSGLVLSLPCACLSCRSGHRRFSELIVLYLARRGLVSMLLFHRLLFLFFFSKCILGVALVAPLLDSQAAIVFIFFLSPVSFFSFRDTRCRLLDYSLWSGACPVPRCEMVLRCPCGGSGLHGRCLAACRSRRRRPSV